MKTPVYKCPIPNCKYAGKEKLCPVCSVKYGKHVPTVKVEKRMMEDV
jgi:hypothetical protein